MSGRKFENSCIRPEFRKQHNTNRNHKNHFSKNNGNNFQKSDQNSQDRNQYSKQTDRQNSGQFKKHSYDSRQNSHLTRQNSNERQNDNTDSGKFRNSKFSSNNQIHYNNFNNRSDQSKLILVSIGMKRHQWKRIISIPIIQKLRHKQVRIRSKFVIEGRR